MPRSWGSVLGGIIEGGILGLVCAAPWALGATAPRYEFALDCGLATLAVLWAARRLLVPGGTWAWCPVAACLVALVLVAVVQIVPLPRGLIRGVAPATAGLYDLTLPDRPETLPDAAPLPPLAPPAGTTLSLDRGVTRRDAGRLLAVVLLFALVRGNVDPVNGLRRLAVAALVNGTALGFFGLIQALAAPPKTIYWVYSTTGGPFGPFINRNHFAFYENLCIGLAVGLLLGRDRSIVGAPRPGSPGPAPRGGRSAIVATLREPTVIGIGFAVGIMMTAVLFSLSRGGFLALLTSLLFATTMRLRRFGARSLAGWGILAVPVVALALACWIGYAQITTRLATLRTGEAIREQRSSIWLRALPVVRDFPLVGTGCGTYEFADMLHRPDAEDAGEVVDHAHNDYLEMLVEGGLAFMVPAVLVLVLTLRRGLAGAARWAGTPAWGPVVGGLMALVAVAVHTGTDFSLHIPSCTALVVVLVALLSGLPNDAAIADRGPSRGAIPVARGILVAVAAVAAGLVVAREGWRASRVAQIRDQVYDLDRSGDPARLGRKIALLDQAAGMVPEDYLIREDLATAHLDAYDQGLYESTPRPPAAAGAAESGPAPNAPDRERLKASHLIPALRHLQRSRDLSPVRALVHLELAEQRGGFATAEPRGAYLERAKLLAPGDPDLWFRCGELELQDGRPDRAWQSFRQAATLSDRWLPEILSRAGSTLSPAEILDRVLPRDPDRLMAAAACLPAGAAADPPRRAFQEAALALLERRAAPPSAEELHLRAETLQALGRIEPALDAYRLALAREPMRHPWRLERAELSARSGRFEDSRQDLLVILGLQPENQPARALLDQVARKLAEGK